MPIYEYVCEKCGAHSEVLQKVTDAPLKRCKECKGKLEKVISRTSFQLKGSGWYKTDYASGGSTAKAEKTEKSEKSEKKSEKKTDSSSSSGSTSGGSSSSSSD